uniref:Uncharacterized protein n=1 Tax=viral metagenome TaxID=1070528 RepID=A0A6C0LI94_9ZZZZ
MIIEYSIGELKRYYRDSEDTQVDYTQGDLDNICLLEDRLSELIDTEYTQNSIYHIFPVITIFAISSLFLGVFLG